MTHRAEILRAIAYEYGRHQAECERLIKALIDDDNYRAAALNDLMLLELQAQGGVQ